MGCNCRGGNRNGSSGWVFVAPNGSKTTYGTEVEAKAAKIRAGGGKVERA